MQMRIERREAFNVIGRQGQGPSRFGPIWIRPLWRDLEEEFDSIVHLARRGPSGETAGTWGLMSDARDYLSPWGEEGRYLAGYEVNPGASPPKGWTLWSVPTQIYLVAACERSDYQTTYERVMTELVESRRYQLAGAVHEHYPPDAPGEVELFIPIKAAAQAKSLAATMR